MTLQLTEDDQNFLEHYGVKGMKWGVRRSQAQLDSNSGRPPTNRQKRRSANEAKVARRKRTHNVKDRKRSATVRNLAGGVGKLAVTRLGGKWSSNLVAAATGSKTAALGAALAGDILSVKVLVNTVQNQRDINRVRE